MVSASEAFDNMSCALGYITQEEWEEWEQRQQKRTGQLDWLRTSLAADDAPEWLIALVLSEWERRYL